ncbi:Trm112 family protein [Mesorhizobium sp. ANAO-SY3R2]|uniref:Trm112 family protein n=1 Tax=Mesorhizobium sp. ANAO-SY3R2 TaxID=3166644 RepID=UPI0036715246
MVETSRRRDIDVKLLELLACPLTKAPLIWDAERSELVSRLARLAYPVRDGIPVMLPSEARQIFDPEEGPKGAPPASR